jgi:ribose 5-phosphate isomerase B
VKLTRAHNNANVLSIGAHITSPEDALQAIEFFLETKFSEEERHIRRINKISELEKHV